MFQNIGYTSWYGNRSSICNTIVQAHGGQISAHNHAHGAEFLFTLPKGDI